MKRVLQIYTKNAITLAVGEDELIEYTIIGGTGTKFDTIDEMQLHLSLGYSVKYIVKGTDENMGEFTNTVVLHDDSYFYTMLIEVEKEIE